MELPESARELLRKKSWGQVITQNRDGSPQVTMVWVDEDRGDLMFNTNLARLKTRNLRRDPRVVVAVQDIESPRQYLVVHGRAELEVEGAYEHINRLAHRFMGKEYPKRPGEQRVIVRVKADRFSGYGPWMPA